MNSISAIGAANTTCCSAPNPQTQYASPSFGNSGTDKFGSSKTQQTAGSKSPFGLVTGALACCALPFFALGALIALAGVAAIRRGFNTAKGITALIPTNSFQR